MSKVKEPTLNNLDVDNDWLIWLIYEQGETETPFNEWIQRYLPSKVNKADDFGWVNVIHNRNAIPFANDGGDMALKKQADDEHGLKEDSEHKKALKEKADHKYGSKETEYKHGLKEEVEHKHGLKEEVAHKHGLKEEAEHKHGLKEVAEHKHGLKEEVEHKHGLKEVAEHKHGLKEEVEHKHGLKEVTEDKNGLKEEAEHKHGLKEETEHKHGLKEVAEHKHGLKEETEHKHRPKEDAEHTHGSKEAEHKHGMKEETERKQGSKEAKGKHGLDEKAEDEYGLSEKTNDANRLVDCGGLKEEEQGPGVDSEAERVSIDIAGDELDSGECDELDSSEEEEGDLDRMFISFEQLLLTGDKYVTFQKLKQIALNHNILSGKWLFFASSGGKIDHLWTTVATAIVNHELPCTSAKVSTFNHVDFNHVVCIYNDDFTNYDQVMKSEQEIRKMGIKSRLLYKPDVYTYFGIYSGNKWKLKPYILISNFDALKGTSVVKFVQGVNPF